MEDPSKTTKKPDKFNNLAKAAIISFLWLYLVINVMHNFLGIDSGDSVAQFIGGILILVPIAFIFVYFNDEPAMKDKLQEFFANSKIGKIIKVVAILIIIFIVIGIVGVIVEEIGSKYFDITW